MVGGCAGGQRYSTPSVTTTHDGLVPWKTADPPGIPTATSCGVSRLVATTAAGAASATRAARNTRPLVTRNERRTVVCRPGKSVRRSACVIRPMSGEDEAGLPRPRFTKSENSTSFISNNLRNAEHWPQASQCSVRPGLRRSRRDAECGADLVERKIQVVAKDDDLAMVVTKPAERLADSVVRHELVLRRLDRSPVY